MENFNELDYYTLVRCCSSWLLFCHLLLIGIAHSLPAQHMVLTFLIELNIIFHKSANSATITITTTMPHHCHKCRCRCSRSRSSSGKEEVTNKNTHASCGSRAHCAILKAAEVDKDKWHDEKNNKNNHNFHVCHIAVLGQVIQTMFLLCDENVMLLVV